MVDEQKLRQLAVAATPGPWYLRTNRHPETDGRPWGWLDTKEPGSGSQAIPQGVNITWTRGERSEANARLIAAANPAAILSLLDELQTLREERTAWRVTAENAEAAVKQARIDALEEVAAICKANAAMCSEGVMRLTLEANAAAIESTERNTVNPCKGKNCGCTDGISHSEECRQQHDDAIHGVLGPCSAPIWLPGAPAGNCGEKSYGNRPPSKMFRNYCQGGRLQREDGLYDGYVPGLACPIHGGPKRPNFEA